jgi:hypothetical protein
VLLGIAYQPGMTNLPGTALLLMGMGLLVSRLWWASGVVFALSVGAKITAAPIALGVLVAALLVSDLRRRAVRSIGVFVLSLAGIAIALAISGSLLGYSDILMSNLRYSGDVMVYFGLAPDPIGHLQRLTSDMDAGRWWTSGTILLIGVVGAALWRTRSQEMTALLIWLWVSIAGTIGALVVTYVWLHHWQLLGLPAVLALISATGIASGYVKERWQSQITGVVVAALVVVPLGGWIPIERLASTWQSERATWPEWRSQLKDRSLESKLLETVPLSDFMVARLGSNDDASFLTDLPTSATLVCPRFHLYDFSPPDDFAEAFACLDRADAVLMTDQFVTFQNGGQGAVVKPIVDKVLGEFSCLRAEDRQVCVRR